jgi:hypothetical protein
MPFAHVGNAEGAIVMVKRIVDAKARFRSLAKPRIDTGTSTGRLMFARLGVADRTRRAAYNNGRFNRPFPNWR